MAGAAQGSRTRRIWTTRLHNALAAALLLTATGLAQAQTREVPQNFDIPAGTLIEALDRFGEQSGLQVTYDARLLRGKKAPSVSGQLNASAALARLLQGTGLASGYVNDRTVIIKAETSPAEKPPAPRPRPQSKAETSDDQDIVGLPAIMVQGTRTLNMDIQRTADDPQPYVVFDREKIQQSGAPNLESFLRDRLPMNANGEPNGLRVTQLGTQSQFNLRGLGGGQTLILINGRRATPGPSFGSTPLQTDINGIPMSAVERIEVLPTTASGIYGGSATGGVINIILRQDYAGAEVKATYGNTFDSDIANRRLDLSLGFNPGKRTNVLVTASYSDQNSLHLRDRPELVERYYDIVAANAPGLLLPPNSPPLGATTNIRSADGSNLVLRNGTSLNSPITHTPAGYAGTAVDGGNALVANAGQYDLGLANTTQHVTGGATQIGQAPRSADLRATLSHEFSPKVRAFLEANASETRTFGTAPAIFGSPSQPVLVSADAPNNPFTSDVLVATPLQITPDRLGTTVTQHRATGGLIVALPADWQAAADYTWGETRAEMDGTMYTPSAAASAAIFSGAIDVLRDTGTYPVDLSPYLMATEISADPKITFQDVALRFAGPFWELPGGQATLSTLLEYREEKFAEASMTVPSLSMVLPSRSASATSVYVEAKFPFFSEKNRRPGLEALDLQLAVRADEYHTLGKTGFVIVGLDDPVVSASNETRSVNPTVALRYQPVEDLVLRTSYGTGFVPPNVSQLAPSVYPAPLQVIDPRRGGTVTTLQIGQFLYQGHPDLKPEESRNWSAGFILTPRVLPDLRLSLDYTRIRKTDNIASYPTGYQGVIDDEALHPNRVQRGANLPDDPAGWAGPITLLDFGLFNIASAEVEAFDLQLDYSRETALGTFGFSTVATWQTHYRTTGLAGQPTQENVGVSYVNPQKFTGNAELRWQRGAWTAGWLARYHHSYLTADPASPASAPAIELQGNDGRVPSQIYHDLYVNWVADLSERSVPKFLLGTEFQFGIRNIFDKLPPFDANYYNLVRTFHSPLGDPLGATYQLTITKRF